MSSDLVYVRTSPSNLQRAHSDRWYAFRLADEQPTTPQEPHKATNLAIPRGFSDTIRYVLSPEKLRTDPFGNDPGDDLIGQIMVGRHVLNDHIDTGYGRPHYLEPARVLQASVLLDGVSPEEFESKAHALVVAGHSHMLRGDLGITREYYAQLRWFYRNAAEQGQAVIVTPM